MENNNLYESDIFELKLEPEVKDQLLGMATWARIIAVAAFFSMALSFIVTLTGGGKSVSGSGTMASIGKAGELAGVIISTIIGVILNLFLYRFATQAKRALETTDQTLLEGGLNNLTGYFKMMGILLLIVLVFAVLGFLLIIMSGGRVG